MIKATGSVPNPISVHEQFGSITDGETPYNNYITCYFLIQALNCPTCTIKLTYTEFDTEPTYDYVQHYSDAFFAVPFGPRYSGKTMPPVQNSPGIQLGVSFNTDYSNPAVYQGWFANWEIVGYNSGPQNFYCDGANATIVVYGTTGGIASQKGTQYGNNWYCSWKISPTLIQYPSIYTVALSITTFAVEQGFDQLRLYRDLSFSDQIESTFNSANSPQLNTAIRYQATAGMSIQFQTDFSGTAAGFSSTFTVTQTNPTFTCDGRTNTIDTTGYTRAILSDRAGRYAAGWNCKWIIPVSSATKQVTLKFSEFETRSSVDYVRVYNDITFSTLIGTYSGSSIPPNFVSTVGKGLSVQFTSSSSYSSNQYNGFSAEYKIYELNP
jgi:hypothetical protein